MGKNNGKFKIGNPQSQLDKLTENNDKYKIGMEGVSFHEIRDMK